MKWHYLSLPTTSLALDYHVPVLGNKGSLGPDHPISLFLSLSLSRETQISYRTYHKQVMSLSTFSRLAEDLAGWLDLNNFPFLLGLVARRHSTTTLSLMPGDCAQQRHGVQTTPWVACTRSSGLVTKQRPCLTLTQPLNQDFQISFFFKQGSTDFSVFL